MTIRTRAALAGTLLLVTGTACSADPAPGPSTESLDSDDHGEVAGAQEVAEPQLHLVTIAPDGAVGMLDLLTEEAGDLDQVGAPSAVATDGRYVLATVPGGVDVVDSGAWTWDHGDHFHYYRAEPRALGTVAGTGPATIATGPLSTAGGTGVFFEETGEAVLLDNAALARGAVEETFRLEAEPHAGLVAPFADGAVVSVPDGSGGAGEVELVGADGEPVDGFREECADASGTITTVVGLVVGCADGALLWTYDDGEPAVERIAYPDGLVAPPARTFDARKGRPTVAALAGRTGFWLLDTRERSWDLVETGTPLVAVSASDDADGHVVALDRSGRVRVYAAGSGEQLAATGPLLAGSLRDDAAQVGLVVDQGRAYVNAPADGVVLEIDYADGARIARRLETQPAPAFFAETGR
ncbi:ABC transporter [Nocardioides hwasunensis]|uniref:ABC transporter n=1 Tax=Nocardioides hwasunensis TaxID=397258 RepID=A0ABR8MHZ9_9ACTN|nr:ABC transporter [Nocardioides hwasunensis]MBD3915687.1 ABC transporter [Nocardioides hwasunensis]